MKQDEEYLDYITPYVVKAISEFERDLNVFPTHIHLCWDAFTAPSIKLFQGLEIVKNGGIGEDEFKLLFVKDCKIKVVPE